MQTEIEAKFLDIDPEKIRDTLKNSGAELIVPERLMKRKTFDFPDLRLNTQKAWIRVRDEGGKITLAYKQLNDRTLHGTREIDIEVNNFESACGILSALGLTQKSYQETRREEWALEGCEVTLDTWPWIPPVLEIEGPSESSVKTAAQKLGLDWSRALHGSVENAYQAYYEVTEHEIDTLPEFKFETPCPWPQKSA